MKMVAFGTNKLELAVAFIHGTKDLFAHGDSLELNLKESVVKLHDVQAASCAETTVTIISKLFFTK